jgi:hypothetical protein
VFYINYLLIKTKLNNNGANMPKSIQFKKLLLLMLLFSSSTNVLSDDTKQIKRDDIKNQWQDSRYTDHEDGTVTDKKTGLMWKQCPEGLSDRGCATGTATKHTWMQAIKLAENTTFPAGSHSDWRLPNIKELASLAAYDRYNPAINSTFFPNLPISITKKTKFWSSSPVYYNPSYSTFDYAHLLDFYDGSQSSYHRYDINNKYPHARDYVRLVRYGW